MTAAVKSTNNNDVEHRREIATTINQILLGRINTASTLTVANGTTSTVVDNPNAHAACVPVLTPSNATAAALVGSAGGVYVSARAAGSFTLTHPNPGASATFLYVLLG